MTESERRPGRGGSSLSRSVRVVLGLAIGVGLLASVPWVARSREFDSQLAWFVALSSLGAGALLAIATAL